MYCRLDENVAVAPVAACTTDALGEAPWFVGSVEKYAPDTNVVVHAESEYACSVTFDPHSGSPLEVIVLLYVSRI